MRGRSAARSFVNAVFPFGPCLLCGEDSRGGPIPGICRACWRARTRPTDPACPCCGAPLPPVDEQEPHVCGACLVDPPAFEAHASAFLYKGPVRTAMLLYKESRRYPLAGPLGSALARTVRGRWPEAEWDALVYVPSPLRRRLARGFEPAGLIARRAAERLGLPCVRALRVRKSVKEQKGLSLPERRKNVRGVFEVDRPAVRGKRVLLVDDVMTTGATLRQVAKVLKRAGAEVHAATVAMVVRRDMDLVGADDVPVMGGVRDHG